MAPMSRSKDCDRSILLWGKTPALFERRCGQIPEPDTAGLRQFANRRLRRMAGNSRAGCPLQRD
jgi:hypothetical protein